MRKWERLFRKTVEHTSPEEEPQIIKAFGLTPEQAADPVGTMLDAGVDLLYATQTLIRIRECMRIEALVHERDADEDRDFSDATFEKWDAREDEFKGVFCGRMWREISGMSEDAEDASTPGERAEQIGKLFNAVEKLARYELNAHAAKRAAGEKDARTYLWDPLASICTYLAISQRKLTTLSKEYTGMAAHELIDRIRAERVKEKMRADLRPFVANFLSTQRHEDTKTPSTESSDGKPADAASRSTNPQSAFRNPQSAISVSDLVRAESLAAVAGVSPRDLGDVARLCELPAVLPSVSAVLRSDSGAGGVGSHPRVAGRSEWHGR